MMMFLQEHSLAYGMNVGALVHLILKQIWWFGFMNMIQQSHV